MKGLTDKVRLAFLANGQSVHIERWLTYLASKGYDIHLITFTAKPIKRVKIHEMKYFVKFAHPLRILNIRKAIKEINPDILHAHCVSHYGIYGALTSFHPLIISVWGSDVLRVPIRSKSRKYVISWALKKADCITTTAEFMKNYLIETFGLPRHKIVRVPWGVDPEIFHQGYQEEVMILKRTLGIKPNAPIIISHRCMKPLYGIESIIDAIPYVTRRHPHAVFIFIRGRGSIEFENRMKLKAKKLGIIRNVRFISKHLSPREMAVYLNMADIFISVPKTDQFGCSVLEGMSCGVIPVVSNIRAYRQYLKNGLNAFLVDPENPKEIAERIIYCIEHPKIKDIFSRINRKIVEERENWNRNAEKMEKVYYYILNKFLFRDL